MNNKKVPRTLTSAIFLAIVLVAGTFAAISPSFITGANAQAEPYNYGMDGDRYSDYKQDYGMDGDRYSDYKQDYGVESYDKKPSYDSYESDYGKDRDYDKSKKDTSNSVNIKKLKCNNINANLNNVDANFGTPVEGDTNGANGGALAAQGSEAISANGLMNSASNGDRSFIDRENNFAFVCINNNNNTVIGGEEPPIPPVVDECVLCLNANLTFAEIITRALEVPGPIEISSSLFTLIIGEDVTTIPELCDLLREEILAGNVDQSEQHLREVFYVVEFVDPDTDAVRFSESVISLVECLLDVDFG